MLLAIDSGNTNIVFAIFGDSGKLVETWRLDTEENNSEEILNDVFREKMHAAGLDGKDVSDAIIATVVPKNRDVLVALCRQITTKEPLVVGESGVTLGLKVLLDHPDEVGADRLVNAVGAIETYTPPLICVDFGTATTFDVIDADGNYAGGVIAPGINLSLHALHAHAARLPHVTVMQPPKVIGTNTVDAMQSGIYWGYVSMIEGLVKRIRHEFGATMQVIATGGLSPLFSQATDSIDEMDTDLTVRGLYILFQRNRSI